MIRCKKNFLSVPLLAVSFVATCTAADDLRTVALTGASPSGDIGGSLIEQMLAPVINSSGQVAFIGRLNDQSRGGGDAVFSEGGGAGLSVIARSFEGQSFDASATGPQFEWNSFSRDNEAFDSLRLNDNGHVAFLASVIDRDEVANQRGLSVWSEGNGNGLELVAKSGDRAPRTSDGYTFARNRGNFDHGRLFQRLSLDSSGRVTFSAIVESPPHPIVSFTNRDTGVWRGVAASELKPFRLPPGIAEDNGPTGELPYVDVVGVRSNSDGLVSFVDFEPVLNEPGIPSLLKENRDGSFTPVVRLGDQAVGRPGL